MTRVSSLLGLQYLANFCGELTQGLIHLSNRQMMQGGRGGGCSGFANVVACDVRLTREPHGVGLGVVLVGDGIGIPCLVEDAPD